MNTSLLTTLDGVMQGLMSRYAERVPDVKRVVQCMIAAGIIRNWDDIENDHIAFRTMGVPQLGIQSLEKIFLHYGYQRRERYHFEGKKLDAFWYAPPTPKYPRIFISELRVADMSPAVRSTIESYTAEVHRDPVLDLNLDDAEAVDAFLHRPLWRTPKWSDYQRLAAESEYAAWVIYNRYYLNHFTVSVHNLPAGFNTVEEFNVFLEKNQFKLNDSGGKAKVSGDGLLIQSSTVAQVVQAEFATDHGGSEVHPIAGSYVEFAERRPLPQFAQLPHAQLQREHRRDGFETASADKIFESTYSAQVKPTM